MAGICWGCTGLGIEVVSPSLEFIYLVKDYSIVKSLTSEAIKFGLSEKHTKFEKIFLMVLKNQLIYFVNVKNLRKIFSNYVYFSKSPNFNTHMYVEV